MEETRKMKYGKKYINLEKGLKKSGLLLMVLEDMQVLQ